MTTALPMQRRATKAINAGSVSMKAQMLGGIAETSKFKSPYLFLAVRELARRIALSTRDQPPP